MLHPRSPSDCGHRFRENFSDVSQKMAVMAWKAANNSMPSRIAKQKANVVANQERCCSGMATALRPQSLQGDIRRTVPTCNILVLHVAPVVCCVFRIINTPFCNMHMHIAEDRPPRVVSADAAMQADASHPPASTDWAELPRENAQVHDIALYKRERAVHSGSLIAVNANYTCYAIRGARFPSTAQSGSRGPTAARLF